MRGAYACACVGVPLLDSGDAPEPHVSHIITDAFDWAVHASSARREWSPCVPMLHLTQLRLETSDVPSVPVAWGPGTSAPSLACPDGFVMRKQDASHAACARPLCSRRAIADSLPALLLTRHAGAPTSSGRDAQALFCFATLSCSPCARVLSGPPSTPLD